MSQTEFSVDIAFQDLNDDNRIEYIQRERVELLNIVTRDEKGDRSRVLDNESVNTARAILKDMGTDIYTKRRLATDEVSAETDKRVADLAERIMGRDMPTRRDKGRMAKTCNGPIIDETRLPTFALTDGETSEVGDTVDINQINAYGRRMQKGVTGED